ncbi:hypothetical protein [Natrialba aegyptia]|uniref:Uncharacterized protein n=1 Tax=Natrialba aegyptia DSM 13077 TaxID=1227491 RepID=M0AQC1_9EURY|nr:hypothetical protein [Natrialba aegyptia]ELY99568.1 hypothetical protein C480_19894 [Natrialba aegyptia DSM 13077]
MSQQTASKSSLPISEDDWKELIVPYGKIKNKWDSIYDSELEDDFERTPGVKKLTLLCYYEYLDIDEKISKKEDALEKILDKNEKLKYDLYAVVYFSKYCITSPSTIKSCFDRCESLVDGTDYEDLYDDISESPDQVARAALLHFIDYNLLKDIIVLDHCHGQTPSTQATIGNSDKADKIVDEAGEIRDHMEQFEDRDIDIWHDFEHEGEHYVAISREIGDDVEQQVEENLEEAPAELVTLRTRDGRLEVMANSGKIASRARSGLGKSDQDFDIEMDPPSTDSNDVSGAISTLDSTEGDSPSEMTLRGLKNKNSPLHGSPTVEIRGESDISMAIEQLREEGYDLTESIGNVERFDVRYDGKTYNLYPEPAGSGSDDGGWIVKYGAQGLSDTERRDFEEQAEELLDIPVIYEKR